MNFVFEDLHEYRNFVDNWTLNFAESERFTVAPIFNRCNIMSNFKNSKFKGIRTLYHKSEKPDKYIISLGVNNDPGNWAGGNFGEFKNQNYPSLFDYLDYDYLSDLQNNKAFLLIDSSFEGYHEQWIFDFFHSECNRFNISPKRIIFVTGNSMIEECYAKWLIKNPQSSYIKVIPYSCFEFDTFLYSTDLPHGNKTFPPSFSEHIIYKKLNPIKTFCNLNKKPRHHRKIFYSLLHNNNLLDKGLISMNEFDDYRGVSFGNISFDEESLEQIKKTLPHYINNVSNELYDTGFYVKRFNNDVCLQSYLSVISEAQYEDTQKTIFLSEKIFKVIAASHPFIVLGNKNSLTELRKLGYQTFSKWFDESYDVSSDHDRFYMIIENLKNIDKIENKLDWFLEMKEVLEYNKNLLRINSTEKIPYAVLELQNHYYSN